MESQQELPDEAPSFSKPFSYNLLIPDGFTMKCLAVVLTRSQSVFYFVMGLLAVFFVIMNVLWFKTSGGGAGMLISMVVCPFILCCLSFSSFRMYRGASIADLSDGEVRVVCMKGMPGNVYAVDVEEGEHRRSPRKGS